MVTNRWGSSESVSGPGSTMKQTALIRAALPSLFRKFGIRRLVDAPCGDCNWISHIEYEFDLFIGCDIVPDLIQKHRKSLQNEKRRFQVADISQDILPAADAVLCRDCLVHLPYVMIEASLRNFVLAGFKYVLMTTFPGRENKDIPAGHWRPLDMEAAPFCLPSPLQLIRERPLSQTDQWNDKHLGLWRMDALTF
jgi:hypothetical protein